MPGVETVQPAVPDSSEEGQTEQNEVPAPKLCGNYLSSFKSTEHP